MEKGKKISNNYAIYQEKLGEGAFGVIYKGFSKKDNRIVAIKKLKGEGAAQWFSDPKFKLETEVLLKVKHPNVVMVYEALELGRDVYIIMEYCDSGDLKKKMTIAKREHTEKGQKQVDGKGPFSNIFVYDIFCQICAGMAEVNRNSILFTYSEYMHRDLKLENVMLTDVGTVKIADFGLARGIIGNDLYKMERFSAKGTPLYAAPDILQKKEYSVKCDVFSLGLMIYEMLAGKHLFSTARNMTDLKNLHKDMLEGKKLKVPETFPKFFQQMLPRMITFDEKDRIGFLEIEAEVLSKRYEIGVSIDEKYQYEDLATNKKYGGEAVFKPSTNAQTAPQTFNPGAGTVTMMTVKQTEEKYVAMKNELFNYAYYVYMRGRLMVELLQLMNQPAYPIANFFKYTLSFLELGIFMNENREMKTYLMSKTIKLPSGTIFEVYRLPSHLQASLEAETKGFTAQIDKEEGEFGKMLKQMHAKLSSADYRAKFAPYYAKYPDVYTAFDYYIGNGQLQNAEFFAYYFQTFLKSECVMKDYRQQPENIVRIYNMALTLTQLKAYLPDSDYMQGDTVEYARQSFNTSQIEGIYHRIASIVNF